MRRRQIGRRAAKQRRPASRRPADIARRAADQLGDLVGTVPERIVALERGEHGWPVQFEVVELRRIPETSDVLAVYEVELDSGRDRCESYRRVERYPRGRATERPMTSNAGAGGRLAARDGSLADILERVLDKGIVIAGDIRVSLLDIELLTIRIRLLVASVDKAREMGIDWWEHDPSLSGRRPGPAGREPGAAAAVRRAGGCAPRQGLGGAGMTAVSYVYALIRPLPYPATTLPVPGMDGADVRVVDEPEIAALVSSVDADTFSAGALRDGINDLQWLERAARTHDSVIDSAINMTTAIPLRLGTTCPDDGSVGRVTA